MIHICSVVFLVCALLCMEARRELAAGRKLKPMSMLLFPFRSFFWVAIRTQPRSLRRAWEKGLARFCFHLGVGGPSCTAHAKRRFWRWEGLMRCD